MSSANQHRSKSGSSKKTRRPGGLGSDADASLDALAGRLHFSPESGRIWFDNRRMLLVDSFSMGALRNELIESVGVRHTRGLLTRMGYASGTRDAQLAQRLRPGGENFRDAFLAGPHLSAMEGLMLVEPVKETMDVAAGQFYGEYLWRDSSEGEIHVNSYGIGNEPVCWMQVGYASGFTSVFMGKPILFREVQCSGMGHEVCRVIGRPYEEWEDGEEDLKYFQSAPFVNQQVSEMTPVTGSFSPRSEAQQSMASSYKEMVGVSSRFNAACHMLNRVAPTDATVLFLGESGVGKEMFARTLHSISHRADGPFIPVNCAAIPDNLVESELFGVEKGAYTGAVTSRPGRFELADRGTLFLDEVTSLSQSAQGKLLRALQENEIERVGGTQLRRVDVRVVAATNLDLRDEVKEERFREDLFFRLNVFPIRIPPLRDRRDDIPLLMDTFLKRFDSKHGRSVTGFTERAIEALLAYQWPGNIRELENVIERGVIMAPANGPVDIPHLFTYDEELMAHTFRVNADGTLHSIAEKPPANEAETVERLLTNISATNSSIDSLQERLISEAMKQADGNVSKASRLLGISRSRLDYYLKKNN